MIYGIIWRISLIHLVTYVFFEQVYFAIVGAYFFDQTETDGKYTCLPI